MSISPVQITSPVTEPQSAASANDTRTSLQSHANNTAPTFPPESKNVQTPEGQISKNVQTESQSPEDEVQLQRDSELGNQLIVRYVDKAGDLILQVPAEQMLDFERAIAAEFEHSKPPRQQVGESGESHGH